MPREPVEQRLARAGLSALPRTAWLEIDLDALRANLAVLRELVGPGVRVEPVVKADAYGHGAVPVAVTLEAAGADGLSVATFDEAVELRDAGVTLPVLVLYPIPAALGARAASLGIAVTSAGGADLAALLAAAALGDAASGHVLDIHLEVETGLGRGGLLPADLAGAVATLAQARGARLAGVWTHLAAADDPASPAAQDVAFGDALGSLAGVGAWDGARGGAGPADVRRHLAGSGGVLGAAVERWDAVRPGIATYGIVPDALTPPPATAGAASRLRPTLALLARAVRVADLPAGHGISYGPTFVTARPSRIATLPLGYGDGWHRVLSDRAVALVRGIRVPLVGRVAMDAVMADVTDVPGPPVTADDEFVLIGVQGNAQISAREVASQAGTISYEVLTAMSRRLPRVYHAAGSPVGLRTLTGGRSEWHASSSGMGISATSRSTRS